MNTHQQLRLEATYKVSLLQKSLLPGQLPPLSTSQSNVEHFSLQLTGALDHSALKAAGSLLLEHHTVLRTAFVDIDTDEPQQRVYQHVELPWREEDWRDLFVNEGRDQAVSIENPQPQALNDWIAADRQQGFSLDQAPLLRLTLVRLSDEEYQLIGCYHPTILDRESIQYLCQELMHAYIAITAQQSVSLPTAQPFRAYIDGLTESTSAEQYWRDYLKDFSAPTPIAIDRRPKVKNSAGKEDSEIKLERPTSNLKTQRLNFTKKFTSALTTLARDYDLTLNSILQGAWAILLSRYSRETEVFWGHRVSGRSMDPEKGIEVGPISHTVPFKTTVDPDAKALSWLQALQKQQQEQQPYQTAPLSVIQSWSGIDSEIPLFHSVIAFNRHPVHTHLSQQLAETNMAIAPVAFYPSNLYSLSLGIDLTDNITLEVDYHAALFETATIKRLLGHYQILLKGIVNNPIEKLGQLPLLTQQEKQQLLVDWNNTQVDYPKEKCIHQLFEAQVEKTPQATAVIFDDQQLTYQELNEKSNQLAHDLIQQGIVPDSRVGLCVERSLETVVGVLGILKAGGAYVPLDPNYPKDRLAYMLEHADVERLLTLTRLQAQLPANHPPVLYLDKDDSEYSDTTGHQNPAIQTNSEDLGYVIYTSGSTGRPKAVAMPHSALINLIQWQQTQSTAGEGARTLQFSPISFDVSFQEMFATWYTGGTLVLVGEAVRKDPFALWQFIDEQQIQRLLMPFIALQQLAEANDDTDTANTRAARLTEIITAGEQLQITPAIRRLFQQRPHCRLVNQYGPSETHVVTALTLEGQPDTWEALPTIGKPIANTSTYLLDPYRQPVPIGVSGELYIGGANLARGYLGRDDLTSECFIQDPFSKKNGARLYKTGDLARYRPDGTIEYQGRADDQVKVRGFRIEPGEIEQVLVEQPDIREAAVTVHTHQQQAQDKYLVAYVVMENNEKHDVKSLNDILQARLADTLPDYMIPAVVMPLPALPQTPSGKVDRRALPTPKFADLQQYSYRAATTEIEKQLTAIWANVLNLPVADISTDTSFLTLGGHSLLATRIASQVRQTFELNLSLTDVFEAGTIRFLAQVIEECQALPTSNTLPLVPIKRTQPLALSFSQQRLWFLHEFEGGKDTRYNEPLALRLTGTIKITALQQAIQTIVNRHEILRTTYKTVGGEAVQVIAASLTLDIPVIQITQNVAPQYLEEQLAQVFDLAEGPLIKVSVLRLGPSEHILFINMHHIACDGWSMEVFGRELTSLYDYYQADDSSQRHSLLQPLPCQYADFSHWQRQWLQGDTLEQQLNYWKKQLADAPALLELPTDRPRPAQQSYAGSRYAFNIPVALTESLRQVGQQAGTTLFMTLLAGFNILLSRYSGQDDICIGTPTANRQREELESLIGFFVNTLVLRTQVNGQTCVNDFLHAVKNTALEAYHHQDIPFEQLVDVLKPERSLSYSPLFQVMFVLQNLPEDSFTLPGIDVSAIEVDTQKSKFDITVMLTEKPRGISGIVEYNTDLFDRTTIERFCNHYSLLLESMAENPQKKLCDLPLLTELERQQILMDWNNTEVDYPKEQCIHQLFETQAEKTPNAMAVVFEGQLLTYEVLNRQSNQLAHYLIEQGVEPESRVGLFVDRSLDMIIGMLGIIKAGGAYVPIDPGYPRQRIEYLIQDSGMQVLLTQEASRERIEDQEIICCYLDSDWQMMETQPTTAPNVVLTPKNLVYVIYTSGSTGKPKGVAVSHDNLSQLCYWHQDAFSVTPTARATQLAGMGFDAMAWEVWPYVTAGASVSLVPKNLVLMPTSLIALLAAQQMTHCFAPTPLVESLLNEAWPPSMALKYLLTGGDKLKQLPTADLPFILVNNYGPTEGTVVATSGVVTEDGRLPPTIGRSISNTKIYIVDTTLNPVPVSVVGELVIGGERLARGYLNRPELTAERFIPNPWSERPGERLYKTGDVVRYISDGKIEFLGRADFQVKIRGFRIELGEIESVLVQQAGVREAIVIAYSREQEAGNYYLVAYIVRDHNSSAIDQITLRAVLHLQLPDYMVPSFFTFLKELPLTPNGKVDRKALPIPDESDLLTQEYVTPRTDMEKVLVDIWADILRMPVEKIGIDDNFFELGGHSLLVTRVISQIHRTFNIEIKIRDVFTSNTVRALASLLEKALAHSPLSDKDAYPLVTVDRNNVIPLSFAQQRLWFLNQLEKENRTQYNIPWALRLSGDLDVASLEKAFCTLVQRHESLRTTFQSTEDQVIQVIAELLPVTFSVIDISEEMFPAKLVENANQVFDLSQGPLFNVALLRLSERVHIFCINMHHIISDGWSIGILNEELSVLYTAYHQGKALPLRPLLIHYADFAHWQRQWLQGDLLEQKVTYWKNQLSGAPALLELPTDRPRPVSQTYSGNSLAFNLPHELTEPLHTVSRESGATLFMTLLAGFYILLARYSGQDDICVGTPAANRQRPELEKIVGFFVNTLVLRVQIDRHTTGADLLQQVKETALSAYAHQDTPFDSVVKIIAPERNLSYTPLFQVMFSLQNAVDQSLSLSDVDISIAGVGGISAKYDMTLIITEHNKGLSGVLEYNTDLFDSVTIEKFVSHYQRILEAMATCPSQLISRISLLNRKERKGILSDWNTTEISTPTSLCIHDLYEMQAKHSPDSLAVSHTSQHITYMELSERSSRVAIYLIEHGVGIEDRVGLCMYRSIEMVIALVGILKAGAAYVPIDPGYPKQRITYLLQDSGISKILTQKNLSSAFDGYEGDCLYLDSYWSEMYIQSVAKVNVDIKSQGLAYVIYTSGSTGQPKGVAVTHGSVIKLVVDNKYIVLDKKRDLLHAASISFDAATFEIWGALLNGSRCILHPESIPTVKGMGDIIERNRIDTLWITTGLFNLLIDEMPEVVLGLRYVLIGGEVASKEHIYRALRCNGSLQILNMYGPTENTTFSTFYPVSRNVDNTFGSIPIGRPIDGVKCYILDRELAPVPIRVVGELYLSGQGLARGYLERPEVTAERFLPNPFCSDTDDRIYKTGDLCRYKFNGDIEFVGRTDDQVKIRGFRIELAEIENLLTSMQFVTKAAVLAFRSEDDYNNHYIVAYIVAKKSFEADQEVFRSFLKSQLPNYMIPNFFILLNDLPITTNGKVDRKKLPKPTESILLKKEYMPPLTEVQKSMVSLWSSILNIPIEKISIGDNFFQLGGHSLLATKLTGKIRKIFELDIDVKDIFTSNTLADFCEFVESAERSEYLKEEQELFLVPISDTNEFPLSFAQRRLWFLNHLEEDMTLQYNIPWVLELTGDLKVALLKEAIHRVILRHDSLRTTFRDKEGQGIQLVEKESKLDIPVISIGKSDVAAYTNSNQKNLFCLKSGPLLKVFILQFSRREYMLVMNMHHIISDGWSLDILSREIENLYKMFIEEDYTSLPPLPVQYTDFSCWQEKWLKEFRLQKQIDYWKIKLRNSPFLLELPADRPRLNMQSSRGRVSRFTISEQLTDSLHAYSRENGVTLFMTLFSCFNILLMRYSGQSDICVGIPVANRQRPEFEDLIGFFVNTLVLRTKFRDDVTPRLLVKEVRDNLLDAYANQDVPFEHLVDVINPERSLSYTPLFQVMFALQNNAKHNLDLPHVDAIFLESNTETSKFDITFSLSQIEREIVGLVEYNTDLFDDSTICRYMDHYRILLEGTIRDPDRPVDEIPILSPVEEKKILVDWNNFSTCKKEKRFVHHIFEEYAERFPDRIALVIENEHLTYGDLNRYSNQLANFFVDKGVGPETKVGLYMDRCPEIFMVILGVIKAGGIYLPIDTEYPEKRVNHILSDSRTNILITQSSIVNDIVSETFPNIFRMNIDKYMKKLGKYSGSNATFITAPLNFENLAYIIYTSGSTGMPKGTMLSHAGLSNLYRVFKFLNLDEDSRVLQFASVGFDAATWEWLMALSCGGRLFLLPTGISKSGERIASYMESYRVTHATLPPTLLPHLTSKEIEYPKNLIVAGEACSDELSKVWSRNRNFYNAYGPTETTICSSFSQYCEDDALLTIGYSIPGVETYVLNEFLCPVPIGVPGELFIGGLGLARGYLEQPSLTAEKFIPNPFYRFPGERLYRSGDLCRLCTDGNIEFLERIDRQVKIRGFRIELGEIESSLLRCNVIKEAVVTMISEKHSKVDSIVAYIVFEKNAEANKESLRRKLSEILPDYMIPRYLVSLDRMPLTQNGKVNYKCLPRPDDKRIEANSYREPDTQTEKKLIEIWAEVLDLSSDKIGIMDNFFELGGHSLFAVRVISHIKEVFGVNVTVRSLFFSNTVCLLAKLIDNLLADTDVCSRLSEEIDDVGDSDLDEILI